jgi:hypothetical protein
VDVTTDELTRADAAFAGNRLLSTFAQDARGLIEPFGELFELDLGETVLRRGEPVRWSLFPVGPTMITMTAELAGGRSAEVASVGREGAVGGIVSQGFLPAYTRIVVKFGGPFAHMAIGKLDAAKLQSKTLRNVFARYADCMMAQMFQSTACNAIHSIEQRTAKWIISAMERTDDADTVPLTHEQLATLLGVGRSYTSRVIQSFKAEAILETRRGAIRVRDVDGLKQRSCLCNEAVKTHFEEVLSGVYPTDQADTG